MAHPQRGKSKSLDREGRVKRKKKKHRKKGGEEVIRSTPTGDHFLGLRGPIGKGPLEKRQGKDNCGNIGCPKVN